MVLVLEHNVRLAPLTTFELGGPARAFARVRTDDELLAALELAKRDGMDVFVLGGGSNLLVSDAGFDGLVVRVEGRGVQIGVDGDRGRVEVAAGEPWDAVVERTIAAGLAGLECLSGIPGSAGATPIQNVGAYGREVAEVITCVRALDRHTGEIIELDRKGCAFGYRDSALKRAPHRWVVLSVQLQLDPDGPPVIRYAELARTLDHDTPSLHHVRRTVLALRRSKSMVLDPDDPNRRSAGSFFTNPIVSSETARSVIERALDRGVVSRAEDVPRYAVPGRPDHVKLAAGWLIESAGIHKGLRREQVGISSKHALALVHHGGGSARQLLDLAAWVRERVEESHGVRLVPEPVLLGLSF